MTNFLTRVVIAAACCGAAVLLAGCTANAPSSLPYTATADNAAAITPAELAVVTEAARTMTGDPAADVHGLRQRPAQHPGHDADAVPFGRDICGYAQTPSGKSVEMYVELRMVNGQLTAERGQIASSPANRAKVKFMCRKHGDW